MYYITLLDNENVRVLAPKTFTSLHEAEAYRKSVAPDRKPEILQPHIGGVDNLPQLIQIVRDFRWNCLAPFGDYDPNALPPMSAEYYLLAINAMDNAVRYLSLANYHAMQGK